MREHDPAADEDRPSRSARRRDALAVLALADTLASMSDAELSRVPLDDALRDEVVRTRKVTSHIARKRQTQYLAKQLRKLDDEALEPIRAVVSEDRARAHREAAGLHRIEAWRDRLIAEGDAALDQLLAAHPSADRQYLRQLSRSAHKEVEQNKPLRSSRELFRALRDLFTVQE